MNGALPKLGIIEFREIVKALNESYNLDYSNFSFTAFTRRIEYLMAANSIPNVPDLIFRIKGDKDFYETFLRDITIEETEMFRDPSLWREVKEIILPELATFANPKIWVPCFSSGEELLSLLILIHEMCIGPQITITASCLSREIMQRVMRGAISMKKIENSDANFKRLKSKGSLETYYKVKGDDAIFDQELLRRVDFRNHNLLKDSPFTDNNLILFRNKMIYFNKTLQNEVINTLHRSLMPGGRLLIGAKEIIELSSIDRRFILVNEAERIYKKGSA